MSDRTDSGSARVLLTVGNGMMGDDGAGPLLAGLLAETPAPGWQSLHGGAAPENLIHTLRGLSPEHVVVFDAADMDAPPGTIRRIADELLEDPFLLTTHTLPLTFLIEALREFVPRVELVGVQPEIIAFGFPMSKPVRQAVERVHRRLRSGMMPWDD